MRGSISPQELSIDFPTDGVTWMETQGGLRADRVAPGSPGSKAGLRAGDVLEAVNGAPTPRLAAQVRAIYENGIYEHAATYSIVRPMVQANGMKAAVPFPVKVYLEAADRSTDQGSRLIALVYLGIGLYVLFRRWTAPKSTHFFVFCLVSFVLYAFRSTGEPGVFDRVIYWGNLLATMLQPALFLHFAVSFSGSTVEGEGRIPARVRRRVIAPLLYLPGAWLVGLQVWAISFWSATGVLSHGWTRSITDTWRCITWQLRSFSTRGMSGRSRGWSGSS